jgi:glycosyltransferase involved in cell wall biosynthesis
MTGETMSDATTHRNGNELTTGWLGSNRVTVVVPALNEAENLPHVLPRIPAWVHEVVLVDDHCTDDTVEVARRLMPDIKIARNERPGGKGNALRAGFEAATGDIIVQLDADGSEDPMEIHSFVGALLAGADYAKGSRFIPGGGTSDMTFLRKAGNFGFVVMVRVLFGVRFTDLCYGYNAFWKRVVPLLALDADGFEIEAMLNLRAHRRGLKIAEVPSYEADRVHGEGRLVTWPDGWRVLKTIWRERTSPLPEPQPDAALSSAP